MGIVSKRIVLNLVLMLLVIGLALGAWWWNDQKNATQLTSIVPFAVGDVKTLVIERQTEQPEQNTLEFTRQDDQWLMTKPKVFPANRMRLRQVLTLIDEPVQAQYDADAQQLTAYGLKPPQVTLTINDEVVALGKSNPVSGNRYVLHQDKVKLIDEAVFGELQSDWLSFVAPQLIPAKATLQTLKFSDGSTASEAQLLAWQKAEASRLAQTNIAESVEAVGTVTAKLADGQTLAWQVGKLPNNDWTFDQVQNGLRYIVPLDQVRSLLPKSLLPNA